MIFHSTFPDVEIPGETVPEFLFRHTRHLGEKAALIDGPTGRTLTFAVLEKLSRRMAAGLAERGFSKGDVLAILSPNLPEYAIVLQGTALAGGILTPINPLYTPREIAHQLTDSGARFLVTVPPFAGRAREAIEGTAVEEIFVIGEAPGATPLETLLATGAPEPHPEIDPATDLLALPYSSGTTGLPKGVMVSHRNVCANLRQSEVVEPVSPDDILLGVLPFFHIYGFTVIMTFSLYRGAAIVTLPKFDLELFLRTIQEYRVTRIHVVPPILLALAKHPLVDRYDLSSLRMLVSAAAPLDAEVGRAAQERIGCLVKQGYGMTESGPVVSVNPDDPERIRLETSGLIVPNTEARIVDPATGEDLGPGQRGELVLRGPQMMLGYLNNPAATARTLTDDGWMHTGDLAVIDEDGYLSIVDRLKELIKYKAFQVAPAELEGLLLSHPAVTDAAVIPLPDPEAGEIPKAFVVTRGEITADELMAYVAERVAPYKKIRAVEFVDQIPKSASGKILRRVLRERERAGA
ncbi:MAG: 4-coumarate--CoA ligase family protein [Acidobacteria bacterium]|nr:4-coumarate--CoA ligase family protein [Acidobacteriota bacterium]